MTVRRSKPSAVMASKDSGQVLSVTDELGGPTVPGLGAGETGLASDLKGGNGVLSGEVGT
jgi:hypothetical protein